MGSPRQTLGLTQSGKEQQHSALQVQLQRPQEQQFIYERDGIWDYSASTTSMKLLAINIAAAQSQAWIPCLLISQSCRLTSKMGFIVTPAPQQQLDLRPWMRRYFHLVDGPKA